MTYTVYAKVTGQDERLNIVNGIWITKCKGNKRTSTASIEKQLKYRIFASGYKVNLVEVIKLEGAEA